MSTSVKEAAQAIVAMMRAQFSAPHTMVLADESQFRHLDLAAYARFQAEMEASGFRAVGDVEILEISNSPTTLIARTFIRNMLSADGEVLAQYYQLRPRIWRRLKLLLRGLLNLRFVAAPRNFYESLATRHCAGFETEFADGRQLVTSNAQAASVLSGPPAIENAYFPYGTPVPQLLTSHRGRISSIAAGEAPTRPSAMRSMEDILAMQRRQSMLKVAHRSAVQWVTQGELRQMAQGQDELSEEVFAEIQRLLKSERSAA
ncbi:hypothetical protein ACS5PN_19150 [Roseateles sp. NT4]|uniref:hypothetical protein n=1 Tax=Roseateles sp. NT4 TaxID=3453715 RepID=UPI003EF08637